MFFLCNTDNHVLPMYHWPSLMSLSHTFLFVSHFSHVAHSCDYELHIFICFKIEWEEEFSDMRNEEIA